MIEPCRAAVRPRVVSPETGDVVLLEDDDYLEQDFKSPEEIRKANLRGADLRGAEVEKADFYLVDLRGARYSPRQAEHFRRCGAILVDRVRRA
jgi:hypothetical protein